MSKPLESRYTTRQKHSLKAWLQLVRVAKQLETDVNTRMVKNFGQRFVRFDILSQLYRVEDQCLSIGDLGAALLSQSGNISALLDRMEADKLIRRIPDPEDRRRQLISMTKKGQAAFDEMALAHAEWVETAFSKVDDEALERLHNELAGIAQALD